MPVRPRLELTIGRLGALALLVAAAVPPAWVAAGPPLCPFRLLTGLPCPGCGLTRSVVSLLHGDVSAALSYHPLGPLLVTGLIMLALVEAAALIARGRETTSPSELRPRWSAATAAGWRVLPWLAVGLFLLVWLVRLPLFLQGQLQY